MAVELLLVRHGESEGNVGRSTDPDCALSDGGLEQASRLADRLAALDLAGFTGLTSPYRRARQTAEVIATVTGLSFTIDDSIREWGPAATVHNRHYPIESGQHLIHRLKTFLARHEGHRLLVVSHAAPIAALIQLAWGETPNTAGAFWEGVSNCSMRWLKSTCPLTD